MNTLEQTNGVVVFRTKKGAQEMNMDDLAKSNRGGSGWWKRPEGELINVVFTPSPDGSSDRWIPVEIQRQIRDNQKRLRREHFERNPTLLQDIIRQKKREQREKGDLCHLHWFECSGAD